MTKRTFFSSDSFWNQPLTGKEEIDPHSPDMIRRLEELSGEGDRGFWLNCKLYTISIYDVDENTPRHTVLEDSEYCHHGDSFENPVPIPEGALPDKGTDMHMALIDWKQRKAWDMFYVHRDDAGNWKSYTGMTYSIDGDGIFDPKELNIKNGDSAHTRGPSRAAAVPTFAGLVLHEELLAGKISHKLSFATCANAAQQFVYPARWTDGRSKGGFPEGCVIRLDPTLDLTQFNLKPAALTIAKALQEYGAVNVDVCGGKCIYLEGLHGHPDKSWEGIIDEPDLTAIGMHHYQVIKCEDIVHMGDARKISW